MEVNSSHLDFILSVPFADDVRELTLEPTVKANADQILKAKKLVKSIRIKFDSRNFENPALQKHYSALQALALERENIQEVPDYVNPDLEGMAKFEGIIDAFSSSVFPDNYEASAKPAKASTKRKAEDAPDGEKPAKKEKATPSEGDLLEAIKQKKLSKFTVPELKAFLATKGVKGLSKMKKDEIVEKVQEVLQQGASQNNDPLDDIEDEPKLKVKKEQPPPKMKKIPSKVLPKDDSHEVQAEEMESDDQGTLPMCQYGKNCYRKNPDHFKQFKHS